MIFRGIAFGSDEFRQECQLRDQVLRAPIGLRLGDEDLSPEQHQKHFGLFDEARNLIACAIVVPRSPTEAQIRQMAVSVAHQKQGWGRHFIRRLEDHLAEAGFVHVFMHARMSAVGFYEKLGYARIADDFIEVGIPHFRMEKSLARRSSDPAPGVASPVGAAAPAVDLTCLAHPSPAKP